MMNLLHWRLLVAVADASNISRAAEEVGMTQPGDRSVRGLIRICGIHARAAPHRRNVAG